MPLNTEANIQDPDGFYDELLRAHEGLSKEQSDALNARLILLLCNHIGDRAIISKALKAAKRTGQKNSPSAAVFLKENSKNT
ncbi:MAG: DUF2783 domain-containing protein [Paracoccaceae bacterium]